MNNKINPEDIKQIDVLNKGFVRLVDFMGDDSSPVQSARVSYGKGTKSVQDDRTLLRYLMRHKHSSVFEMAEVKFHIKAPIFVVRQWFRHRTACITGNCFLNFKNHYYNKDTEIQISIEEFYKGWNSDRKDYYKTLKLKYCNEELQTIETTTVKHIWESGEKKVYEVTTNSGKYILTSEDHLFYTNKGWKKLKEFCKISEVENIEFDKTIKLITSDYLKSDKPFQESIRCIKYRGVQKTYDLSVHSAFHNFVCNNIVVHNSYNEESGRYSEIVDDFYIPTEQYVNKQSKDNKQGRAEVLEAEIVDKHLTLFQDEQEYLYENYNIKLNDGMAKELARINMPLSTYTQFYFKANLRNLFQFLHLRLDSHAQYEIRVFAEAIYDILKQLYPVSCEAFEDYTLKSKTFSRMELDILKTFINVKELGKIDFNSFGLGKRESKEFLDYFKNDSENLPERLKIVESGLVLYLTSIKDFQVTTEDKEVFETYYLKDNEVYYKSEFGWGLIFDKNTMLPKDEYFKQFTFQKF